MSETNETKKRRLQICSAVDCNKRFRTTDALCDDCQFEQNMAFGSFVLTNKSDRLYCECKCMCHYCYYSSCCNFSPQQLHGCKCIQEDLKLLTWQCMLNQLINKQKTLCVCEIRDTRLQGILETVFPQKHTHIFDIIIKYYTYDNTTMTSEVKLILNA